jgi:hypothetical protein
MGCAVTPWRVMMDIAPPDLPRFARGILAMDIERLSRFGGAVKERAIAIWKLAVVQSKPLLHWLQLRPKGVFWAGGLSIALAFLIFSGATAAGAALLAWAALRQASTASDRHQEQTNADRRRRITETYSKAVSQLASGKLEERLGGIYTLESISKESPDDYWTVMETLTAFVRERSHGNYAKFKKSDERISQVAHALWEEKGKPEGKDDEIWAEAIQQGEPPETDIAAVLAVIIRRDEENWDREDTKDWRFDLRQAVLKKPTFRTRVCQWPTSSSRICKEPVFGTRICEEPSSGARSCNRPSSSMRICKELTSGSQICKRPTSEARICKGLSF